MEREEVSASKKSREGKNSSALGPPQQQISRLLEHYQNGQYDDAERLARATTEQFPHDLLSWKILGDLLQLSGRINESLVANQNAVHLDPKDENLHCNIGGIFQ